jgi:hypothetical protein
LIITPLRTNQVAKVEERKEGFENAGKDLIPVSHANSGTGNLPRPSHAISVLLCQILQICANGVDQAISVAHQWFLQILKP